MTNTPYAGNNRRSVGELGQQNKSVLERIKKKAIGLKETTLVEYEDMGHILQEGKRLLKNPPREKRHPPGPGRPRLAKGAHAQNIRVTIPPALYRALEERKKKSPSRSRALSSLLEKGLAYENLRRHQAQCLRGMLKEFASLFKAIKMEKSTTWRKTRILYKKNEEQLAKLYRKSLEINRYLEMGLIDRTSFEAIREYLSPKEIRYLDFASVPERLAHIVEKNDEKTH